MLRSVKQVYTESHSTLELKETQLFLAQITPFYAYLFSYKVKGLKQMLQWGSLCLLKFKCRLIFTWVLTCLREWWHTFCHLVVIFQGLSHCSDSQDGSIWRIEILFLDPDVSSCSRGEKDTSSLLREGTSGHMAVKWETVNLDSQDLSGDIHGCITSTKLT